MESPLVTLQTSQRYSDLGLILVAVLSKSRISVAYLLGLRVRIPFMAWIFVSYVYCVLSRILSLQRADHPFRGFPPVVCLIVSHVETWIMRRRKPEMEFCPIKKKEIQTRYTCTVWNQSILQSTRNTLILIKECG